MRPFHALTLGLLFLFTFTTNPGLARDTPTNPDDTPRILVLDGSTVHNVDRVLLHVGNWGEFGSEPGSANTFSFAPSFQWPNVDSAEHLFSAGLWVGALKAGVPSVSTTVFEHELRPTSDPIDIMYRSREGTFYGKRYPDPNRDDDADGLFDEETLNGRDDDGDGSIDEDYAAISDQMFSCEYFDNEPIALQIYPAHRPLDIRVRQESYVWNENRFDDIVGIKFTIKNVGTAVLEDVYVGMFVDGDIGHRDTPNYWEDDVARSFQFPVTCVDLGPVNPRVAYMYDADADGGQSPGYLGVQFVGHPTDPTGQTAPADIGYTSFRIFNANAPFETGGDPTNDFERYEVMSDGIIVRDRLIPRDYRIMISVGPFTELLPDEEMVVHVAFAIGGTFEGMRFNSFSAVHAYRGIWFDADNDPTTGVGGRETRVDGPAQDVVVDGCADPPVVVPFVPAGESVWINADCATEALYKSSCGGQDSTRTMTGVGGKETQEKWYIPQQDVVPVLIQRFDARAATDHVQLSWEIFADEPVSGYRVYRADGVSPSRVVSEGLLPVDATAFRDYDVYPGTDYEYVLGVALPDGGGELISTTRRVRLGRPTLALEQNHPNPFNPTTTISFTVPSPGPATLAIYDVSGKRIRTLVDAVVPAGMTQVAWDGADEDGDTVGSGVYFYRLTTERGTVARKMIVLK
jgi:hypothetical protein